MKKILALLLVFPTFLSTKASPDWKLKKENDHLKIYTAAADNSPFKLVRVECTVQGTFSQVIAVLFDIDKHTEWVFNDKESKLLKWVKSDELYYYSEVSVPWPCSNRDYIAHIRITGSTPQMLTIESNAVGDYIAEKQGVVRVKSSASKWVMKMAGPNLVKIDYEIQFDPGGSVPAWLINMFVTRGPYETFGHLQERMRNPAYQNVHFDFVKE